MVFRSATVEEVRERWEQEKANLIGPIQQGKHRRVHLPILYDVVSKTQPKDVLQSFERLAQKVESVLRRMIFRRLSEDDIAKYAERELCRRGISKDSVFYDRRVKEMLEDCLVEAQRYQAFLDDHIEVYIRWVPTRADFNKAKEAIRAVIRSFRPDVESDPDPNVEVIICGTEGLFQIRIAQGIHDRARVGFNFRHVQGE